MLTPKICIGGSLICGPNLVIKSRPAEEDFFKRFCRDACGRQFCFRSAKELFALISRDRMVTWSERKGQMDG
jgi:hypothetical protein